MSALQRILLRKVDEVFAGLHETYGPHSGMDDDIKVEVQNTTISISCESATRAESLMRHMTELGCLEVQCFYKKRRNLPYRCVGRIY